MASIYMNRRIGLGCTCNTFSGGLGAITKSQVEGYFIGTDKYVRNTKSTPIYPKPGEKSIKTIAPNDNMGRVVGVNQAGTWGRLDSGLWVYLADSMYTVVLSTPPPNSLLDAVGREVEDLAVFSLKKLLPYAIGLGALLVAINLAGVYVKTKAVTS